MKMQKCKYIGGNSKDVTWKMLFHYSISAAARSDVYTMNLKDKINYLRQSIPLHPVWEDITSNATFQIYQKALVLMKQTSGLRRTTDFADYVFRSSDMQQ